MKFDHEHPLTLIENPSAELLCPDCGNHLDESYRCNCDSEAYACSLCNEDLSGSCYTCKLCWESPIAHQSCFELPEKIQITYYRPHCLLHFEEESSESKELDCDFCNKKHQDYKYRCGDCGFEIGVGCASKLMNLHEGQQHVQHFTHRHPLTLLKLDDMICKLCYKNVEAPSYAYGCAPCNFYIHSSCRDEFLPEIQYSFHPQHSLTLQDYVLIRKTNKWCDVCRFKMQDFGYRCDKCDFNLHPKCLSVKPNIKYKGHDHLLILLENFSYQSKCEACGFDIEGVFFLRCVECRLDFDVQCGSHSLPPTVWLREHKHPLKLGKDDSHILYCYVCGEEINHGNPFYHCVECECFAHVRCSITEVQYDDKGKSKHFSHDHILLLRDIHKNDDICCYGCGKGVQGSAYGCDSCQIYLHKSCTELPRQIHDCESHEHYLTLQSSDILHSNGSCNTCYKALSGFMYRCEPCLFNLDLDCASLHPNVYTDECTFHESQERIAHFSHKHHLISIEVAGVDCKLCNEDINSQCYGCAQCDFYIHNSCAALLQEIRLPFHPRHSLKLLVTEDLTKDCNACCLFIEGLRYRCDECEFELHPECISLKPNIVYKVHKHPLTLVENIYCQGECEACSLSTLGMFFLRCVWCSVNFHVQCGSLPLPSTLHKQHMHPLTICSKQLAKGNSSQLCCAFCNEVTNPESPTYYCVDCEYQAHVRCVITEEQVDERERIKNFSHEHLLFLLECKRNDDNIICVACEKNIQASAAYGCYQCEFYLHKSCVDLPREISHPFHRHPLSLPNPYFKESHQCNACHKLHYGFSYSCQDCKFNLDLDCSLLFPTIKLQSFHEHNLTFFKKLYDNANCDRGSSCIIGQNKSIPLDDYYLRCVTCNFSLHLLCCPLPKTFKHDCHQHSLTLKDNFVDLFWDEFDDEEFCCDFCETRRYTRECVYHCEECNFVVDLDCLFFEVIQFLEGKLEFRTVSKKIVKKVKGLTYNDILKSLTEEEKNMMESLTQVEKMIEDDTLMDMFDELKETNRLVNKRISEELFLAWCLDDFARQHVEGTIQLRYLEEDADAELVNVGDYKISPKLAPVFKKLLEKYGHIFASCTLTQSLKTMLLTTLCGVIQQMREIKVMDIPKINFLLWWLLLKLVQRAGFRIDFALDHVKRIANEYFLIEDARSITINPLYEVHKKIAELSKETDQRKAEIENLKKQALDIVSSHGSERSIFHANCYNQALGSWWKNAAYPLLDDIPES